MAVDEPEQVKRALLETSYKEILDATKHQDDKIGRVLTGIAFLTAAALAYANHAGVGITTRFDLVDRRLPLLAYAIGTFVVGVVLTVTLLLSSLTTSLTLPGSARPSAWTPGKPFSLIYFYSIAQVPKEVWQQRWTQPPADLRATLDGDLVNETFNLAQRTNHKYTRTNEAVALLSFTLFALGVAFVLATVVASTARTGEAVPMTSPARMALGAFAALFVGAHVMSAVREHHLRLRVRGGPPTEEDSERLREFKTYLVGLPTICAALLVPGRTAVPRAIAATVAIMFLGAIAERLARRKHHRGRRLALLGVAAAVIAAAFVSREETWRLMLAAAIPAALTVRNLVEQWQRSRPPAALPTEAAPVP